MEQHITKISNAQIDALPSKTICWNCKKSCGKCSWSESFTPVAGWEVAEGYNSDQRTKTQDVISCPLYEQEYKYFTMDEIFETIAHHFGKHPKTVRRYGKIRTPFVYANKLPTVNRSKNKATAMKSVRGAMRLRYLKNCAFDYHAKSLRIALGAKVVKDRCPYCNGAITGAVDVNYTCQYCGRVIMNVLDKK